MCVGCLCDCLYASRNVISKLSIPFMILDLGLTIYIATQVVNLNVFACCTGNSDTCGYNHLGGATNVELYNNTYCEKINDPSLDCHSTFATCVGNNGYDVNALCSSQVLNEVSNYNWKWFLIFLTVKSVGLVFVLFLDMKALCCDHKEVGEEDQEAAKTCSKCKDHSKRCCISSFIFLLRFAFVIFGTLTTLLCLWLLEWTNSVSFGTCSGINDSTLQSDCSIVENECGNGTSYYAVIWGNLQLIGPYWANLASNILSSVLWVVRMSIIRKGVNKTQLIDV